MTESQKRIPVDLILGSHGEEDAPKLKVFEVTLLEAMKETDKLVLAMIESSGIPTSLSQDIFNYVESGMLPSEAIVKATSQLTQQLSPIIAQDTHENVVDTAFRRQENKILDQVSMQYPGRLLVLHEHVEGDFSKATLDHLLIDVARESELISALCVMKGDFTVGMNELIAGVTSESLSLMVREERIGRQIMDVCQNHDVGVVVARFGTAHIGIASELSNNVLQVYKICDDVSEDRIQFPPDLALSRKARFKGLESISPEDWRQGLVANAWYLQFLTRAFEEKWPREKMYKATEILAQKSRVFRDEHAYKHFTLLCSEIGFARASQTYFAPNSKLRPSF